MALFQIPELQKRERIFILWRWFQQEDDVPRVKWCPPSKRENYCKRLLKCRHRTATIEIPSKLTFTLWLDRQTHEYKMRWFPPGCTFQLECISHRRHGRRRLLKKTRFRHDHHADFLGNIQMLSFRLIVLHFVLIYTFFLKSCWKW